MDVVCLNLLCYRLGRDLRFFAAKEIFSATFNRARSNSSTLRWRGSPLDFLSVPAHSSKELKAHYAALSSVDSQPDGDSLSEEEKLKNLGD